MFWHFMHNPWCSIWLNNAEGTSLVYWGGVEGGGVEGGGGGGGVEGGGGGVEGGGGV